MTIHELILRSPVFHGKDVVYAQRICGEFQSASPAILMRLTEADEQKPIAAIAEKYCPGFDYFMEGFLIQELIEDLKDHPDYQSFDKQLERIIYYAENDA